MGFPLLSLAWALSVLALSSRESRLGRIDLPGAALLATLAYCLYSSPKIVFHFLLHRFSESDAYVPGWIRGLVYAASAIAVAAAIHRAIERPLLRLRERLFPRAKNA